MAKAPDTLPLRVRMPLYRRILFAVLFLFMFGIGVSMALTPGQEFGFYGAAVFFALLGIALGASTLLIPRDTFVVDEEGIMLAMRYRAKDRKKLLWKDIVRIEGVKGPRGQKFLAIETVQDAQKAETEGMGASALRFLNSKLVSDGGTAGEYIAESVFPGSAEKMAARLNALRPLSIPAPARLSA